VDDEAVSGLGGFVADVGFYFDGGGVFGDAGEGDEDPPTADALVEDWVGNVERVHDFEADVAIEAAEVGEI